MPETDLKLNEGDDDARELHVLCEDGPVLAVCKPAGLLTQGVPQGIPTLEAQVRAYIKRKYAKPGNVYLGIPHRLDRPVSGVVVFARNSKAAARLAEQFRDYCRAKRKRYPDPHAAFGNWLRSGIARDDIAKRRRARDARRGNVRSGSSDRVEAARRLKNRLQSIDDDA